MGKIYCTGMSRTGTTSFSDFLAKYGLNVIHYPSKMDMIGGRGDGASDIPVIPMYKDLDKMFRNSKFVHLTRDDWVHRVEFYFKRKQARPNQNKVQVNLRGDVYGSNYWDKQLYGDAYRRYEEDVRNYFEGRDNLLVMNIVDGRGSEKELLDFLGIEDKGIKFPHSNKLNG